MNAKQREKARANSRLIKELLKALRSLVAAIDHHQTDAIEHLERINPYMNEAAAAIAKAEGSP